MQPIMPRSLSFYQSRLHRRRWFLYAVVPAIEHLLPRIGMELPRPVECLNQENIKTFINQVC